MREFYSHKSCTAGKMLVFSQFKLSFRSLRLLENENPSLSDFKRQQEYFSHNFNERKVLLSQFWRIALRCRILRIFSLRKIDISVIFYTTLKESEVLCSSQNFSLSLSDRIAFLYHFEQLKINFLHFLNYFFFQILYAFLPARE